MHRKGGAKNISLRLWRNYGKARLANCFGQFGKRKTIRIFFRSIDERWDILIDMQLIQHDGVDPRLIRKSFGKFPRRIKGLGIEMSYKIKKSAVYTLGF